MDALFGSPIDRSSLSFRCRFQEPGGGGGGGGKEKGVGKMQTPLSYYLALSVFLDSYNPVEILDYSSIFLLLILVNCTHGLLREKSSMRGVPAVMGVWVCGCVGVCGRVWIASMQNQKYVLHTSKIILAYISLLPYEVSNGMASSMPRSAGKKKVEAG